MKLSLITICLLLCAPAIVAAQSQPVKLTGQVVCSDCWFESKDRVKTPYGTASDLKCAADCADKKIPAALAVREGDRFKLYELEDGDYKREGKGWLAVMSSMVEAEGTVRRNGDKQFFKVNAMRVVGPSPVAQTAVSVVGTQPELALRDLSGVEQSLAALRGRVVVLNFWATWCEPCRREMPDLAAIQNDYAALGVQVVGASADAAEDRPKVLQFIRETKINFPIWTGATAQLMPRFGLAPALPGTVVLDREGRIVSSTNAVVKPDELRKQLDALLAAPARQVDSTAAKDRKGRADEHGHEAHAERPGDASTVPS
ncbi:MAG TPA: TlpA disulfide reductase family protein [Pyrinomonadaceae bacterium]|nr:TlpA disulfide reductase family protein [Pyrinomonadaceae bacterium]